MKKIIWIAVAVIVALGIVFLVTRNEATAPVDTSTDELSDAELGDPEAAFILMTDEGFTTSGGEQPVAITIRRGEMVRFVNNTDVDRWPASNIHPTHGIYPEFDPKKPVKPQESWSFTFDKAGTWRFHDHLFPSFTGTVTAE